MKIQNYSALGLTYFLAFTVWLQSAAYGYEVETHDKMSEKAAPLSVNLTNNLQNFGLYTLDDVLTAYGVNCDFLGTPTKTILEWIQAGSICEDDTVTQVFARYKNHFYDPAHNGQGFGGISSPNSGILSGMPAPDWAIDKGPADGQLYSFSQARQYFYDGLTKPDYADRNVNLARMFRTLGDVIHVVQDMAQPQHTRNDGHGLPKSDYEVYTDKKRDNRSLVYVTDPPEPSPAFTTAREYFTRLAQFSNQNFVTNGTNFNSLAGQVVANANYSMPAPGTPTAVPVETLVPPVSPDIIAQCGANTPCAMTFYSTNQTVFNERASTLSIYDQYVNNKKVFTLNRYTHDAAHPFLIPKAVAYSTGMLDYFFRGQMDFVHDAINLDKFTIKNLSAEEMNGDFTLYYDATDGNRYPVPGAAWTRAVPANGQADGLTFTAPSNQGSQGNYVLVFKGTVGQETGAVAAKSVYLPCRTLYVEVTPYSIPTWEVRAIGHAPYYAVFSMGDLVKISTDPGGMGGVWAAHYALSYASYIDGVATGQSIGGTEDDSFHLVQAIGGYGWSSGITYPSTQQYNYMPIYPVYGSRNVYVRNGVDSYPWTNNVVATDTGNNLGYSTLYLAAIAAKNFGKTNTIILLTDGPQIASFPYTVLDEKGHSANYPIDITTANSGWLDLYTDTNDGNGNWTSVFSQRVSFSVPGDVCLP